MTKGTAGKQLLLLESGSLNSYSRTLFSVFSEEEAPGQRTAWSSRRQRDRPVP